MHYVLTEGGTVMWKVIKMNKTIISLVIIGSIGFHSAAFSSEQVMDTDDLRLDGKSLIGRSVSVKGKGMMMSDMFMISRGDADMNSIIVNTTQVSREERKGIIKNCSDLLHQCTAVVTGKVTDNGMNGFEIEAQHVLLK
jgi:hypothetical protein